ncbi:MAG: cyclopropane fatty acyl phospholipid synthase [Natronospirillum sp.]
MTARNTPVLGSSPAQSSLSYIGDLLERADVKINGSQPWDIQIHDNSVAERVLAGGSIGLGESYMDGLWEVEHLDEFLVRVFRAKLDREIQPARLLWHALRARFFNLQTQSRAWQVGEVHYDLSNEFYAAMLDSRMTYTCGYWADATDLEQAQVAKLDLICRKLNLQPGMKVLDIGCGWGSFMSYAAEHYGVECVGLTISREQAAWGNEKFHDLPIKFRLQDYRDCYDVFDRVVSVGMFEHVGHKNYHEFMQVVARCLTEEGLALLHTIGKNARAFRPDPWIDKYIFPNGELPSLGQIGDATDDLLVVEDVHNFGADYDRTLMAWHDNFIEHWPKFSDQLGSRFYRMWRFYLLSSAAAFRARDIQLWQWVMSKDGVQGGYKRVS